MNESTSEHGFVLTDDDTSPPGNALRRVGLFQWAKEVIVGGADTYLSDGSRTVRYRTPPRLYGALAAWYATGVWTLGDDELNFRAP